LDWPGFAPGLFFREKPLRIQTLSSCVFAPSGTDSARIPVPRRRGRGLDASTPGIEDPMTLSKLTTAAALALGLAATAAVAQDIEYVLTNSTSATLIEFYTSPVDADSWENDLLADFDLEPGEFASILIGDGRTQCEYDLLFVFEDESEYTDTVDICELSSYELVEQ
jgi:hypothetical protein